MRSSGFARVLSVLILLTTSLTTLPAAASAPPATSSPGVTGFDLRATLARRLAVLPADVRALPHRLLRFRDVPQADAEELFAQSIAAAYLADTGEVLLLPHPQLLPLAAAVGDVALARVTGPPLTGEALGTASLETFAAEVERAAALVGGPAPQVLVMMPARATKPVTVAAAAPLPTGDAPEAVVMQEGFESSPFATWQRADNSQGQYAWGATTCAAHSGSSSADAIRGGTMAGSLTCTSPYTNSVEVWMWDPRCNSLSGAAQAWLDFYMAQESATGDGIGVYFPGEGNNYYGVGYSGNWPAWFHVILNLKQFFFLGDLTQKSCVELNFMFDSDASTATGYGVRVDDVALRTDAPPFLSCSGTVSPTSGPAPLTSTFTGNVSGASAGATYRWSFGDGSAAVTAQNTTHTYSAPGDYRVSFSVTDGQTRCASYLLVQATQACTLGCTANAPSTAAAGSSVAFQATATPTNCGSVTPTYSWAFGDGATSTQQNASHAYTGAGTYTWTLTVTAGGQTCTRTGSITVTGAPAPRRQLIASVAQKAGSGGTQWRTAVAAVNRNATEATLDLTFVTDSSSMTRTVTVPAMGAVEWTSILSDLFQTAADTSGALQVTSDVSVLLTSRTYNQTAQGTFGQYYPALSEANALRSGQTGVLTQLKKNAAYRTNIGAANLGTAQGTAVVRLFNGAGTQVGNPTSIVVEAGRWKQQSDIFQTSGAGNQDVAYATVEVQGASDLMWVYASVVDNVTGDPTTIPVVWDATKGTVTAVAAAARPPEEVTIELDAEDAPELAAQLEDWLGADPEDGVFAGTTAQNRRIEITIENRTFKRIFISYDCGGWTGEGSTTYTPGCPVTNGSFTCGSTSCGAAASTRTTGTFSTPTTLSGTVSLKQQPPMATCCQINNMPYSASKGGGNPLQATAQANPTSGPAPLAVALTGGASGGTTPYTWGWTFGDGGTSTSQSPSHTYQNPGTYTATLTVTDAQSQTATASVTITVSSSALQVTAQANPTSGPAPLAVSLTGGASGGTPPYSWSWGFGDGGTASVQNPSHTYQSPGTYQATLNVTDSASRSGSATVTITVTSAASYRYLIPSVAHNPGSGGTMWRTTIAGLNRSGSNATLTARFVATDGSTMTQTAPLNHGAESEWVNVMETLFGVSPGASVSGTLEITSTRPVFLTSRTFNQTASGTYGQYFPSLTSTEGLGPGRMGVLPQLKKTAAYRTNIGIVNLGTAQVTALIKLYSSAGVQVGSTKQLVADPGRWVQQYDIFANVGAGNQPVAYATVEVQNTGDLVWAYASVIDVATGDPTTIPLLVAPTQ
ncbi:MAG: PKD domain-containing protein [Thermoanaerobaculaceae bacterium]